MTHSLRFLPEVADDALAAFAWYEAKAQGLGEQFLRAFYAAANQVPRNPMLHTKAHGDFRRCLLPRFPYAFYFTVEGEEVVGFGLFHCARDPETVRAQLRRRHPAAGNERR
ncbi:MAG TPA: hypothetical protein VNE39_16765 [Planctomycetota bacterium]|nr:hypothetical protein [Planctomycetota bacterium]